MFSDLLWWPPQGQASSGHNVLYDQFFSPNSRALLPTFPANCPDGPRFAQVGSHFAQNTAPNLFFTQPSHIPFKDMYLHKTPQSPPQNTPFSGLHLKVGKLYSGQNVWKVGKTFPEVGKFFFSYVSWNENAHQNICWCLLHHVLYHGKSGSALYCAWHLRSAHLQNLGKISFSLITLWSWFKHWFTLR